ncbi:hypothetical protein SCWH03_45440 [Streptomyces pacificus]|uniref:Uncharacterized protein n=1 Tax=Streptomyces pacificus TaxID=2705029 RepID=A0A6A0AZP8_9ACTN|nr:hypothetical protein SCWH03_45440 [Streptomyces pacificus]
MRYERTDDLQHGGQSAERHHRVAYEDLAGAPRPAGQMGAKAEREAEAQTGREARKEGEAEGEAEGKAEGKGEARAAVGAGASHPPSRTKPGARDGARDRALPGGIGGSYRVPRIRTAGITRTHGYPTT